MELLREQKQASTQATVFTVGFPSFGTLGHLTCHWVLLLHKHQMKRLEDCVAELRNLQHLHTVSEWMGVPLILYSPRPSHLTWLCEEETDWTSGGWWWRYKKTGTFQWLEWNKWNRVKYGFHMFDTIPLIPFQPLQWARSLLSPPTSLLWIWYSIVDESFCSFFPESLLTTDRILSICDP
jgi:hypothetical protein